MPAAYDWLVVGDVALERSNDRSAAWLLGGAAARLAAHGAAQGLSIALVGKTGDDPAGRAARDVLSRHRVDLRFAPVAAGQRTTVWHGTPDRLELRRLDRGADVLLRLDEVPGPATIRAGLTLVSGYSLSVEPARSAAIGALSAASARGGSGALQVEADLLWWTNARVARRVLEPAIGTARSLALTGADAAVLFGESSSATQTLRAIGRLGPSIVYLASPDGGVVVLEDERVHVIPPLRQGPPADRFAGPAAFFKGLSGGLGARRAALAALEYAYSAKRPSARRGGPARSGRM